MPFEAQGKPALPGSTCGDRVGGGVDRKGGAEAPQWWQVAVAGRGEPRPYKRVSNSGVVGLNGGNF
jgi:hypothetical protein